MVKITDQTRYVKEWCCVCKTIVSQRIEPYASFPIRLCVCNKCQETFPKIADKLTKKYGWKPALVEKI